MSKEVAVQKWRKYSPEFKRAAVDRITAGESPSGVARELGIRRKFLYLWKDLGLGSSGMHPQAEAEPEPQQREIARLEAKVAELERLTGRQAAELDFFVAALRSIRETRPKSGVRTGEGSTR